jgi:hypothetical protein
MGEKIENIISGKNDPVKSKFVKKYSNSAIMNF